MLQDIKNGLKIKGHGYWRNTKNNLWEKEQIIVSYNFHSWTGTYSLGQNREASKRVLERPVESKWEFGTNIGAQCWNESILDQAQFEPVWTYFSCEFWRWFKHWWGYSEVSGSVVATFQPWHILWNEVWISKWHAYQGRAKVRLTQSNALREHVWSEKDMTHESVQM